MGLLVETLKMNKGDGPTKFDLAMEMLVQLRKSVSCRLWVAMDRWYLSKDFFNFLTSNSYDWSPKPSVIQ